MRSSSAPSRTSPCQNASGVVPVMRAMRDSALPSLLQRLSITSGVMPALASATHVWLPMKPAPPVTRMLRDMGTPGMCPWRGKRGARPLMNARRPWLGRAGRRGARMKQAQARQKSAAKSAHAPAGAMDSQVRRAGQARALPCIALATPQRRGAALPYESSD
jgi:hypothetical protein